MSNLVKQLREEAECYRGKTQACLTNAADRIEQLEAALREIAGGKTYADDPWSIARAALEGK